MISKITSAGSATSPPEPAWSEARETGKQLRRFIVVGLLCVATDVCTYLMLLELLSWPVSVAKGISYLAGVAVGFVLNKQWTFESRRSGWTEAATYLSLYLLTLGVNVGCNRLVLGVLGPEWRIMAFLFATGVTTVLNFLGMRLVTFRRGVDDRRAGLDVTENQPRPIQQPAAGLDFFWRKAS